MTQKQKISRAFIALLLILFLSIIILYLIPVQKKISGPIAEDDSGKEERTESVTENDSGQDKIQRKEEEESEKVLPDVKEREEKKGRIAFVIDDAGNNIRDLLPFLQFPGKLTIAVLPQLQYSTEAAQLIAESGNEVILHQPMEPENGQNPGPGALYSTHTEEEIVAILAENLLTVPGARGANNHMGSKLTANPEKMDIILHYFYEHGLYFLDSKTTAASVCRELASRSGIPLLERHIFLDNTVDRELIREQMKKGITLADKNRYVIMIGHVQNSEVLDVLYEFLPELEQHTLVGLSEIYGK
ncbi:MAG: divergent polysaccharide deacetylase family protein [Spirochaetales bacterium]|nr:divergent polysaccharide deacetylase family protein [Spirochaetales bacterium]